MDKKPSFSNFTTRYNGTSNVLANNIIISASFDANTPPVTTQDYRAIWDTGATHSVISTKVIDDLNLQPIGVTEVSGVHGKKISDTYYVCFYLPNHTCITDLTVTEGKLGTYDALIGMDVINKGDFAVSNKDGKTMFSFRTPSCEDADFIKWGDEQIKRLTPKVGRNAPCPCGSGKKYKKCHGK